MATKPVNPLLMGRPPKPIPMLDASSEEMARAIFSGVKPPNPSIRVLETHRRKSKQKSAQ